MSLTCYKEDAVHAPSDVEFVNVTVHGQSTCCGWVGGGPVFLQHSESHSVTCTRQADDEHRQL